MSYPFRRCLIAVVLCYEVHALAAASDVSAALRTLSDSHPLSRSEEQQLIERVRTERPSKDEATTWQQIANSSKYSDARRARAILQLFDRHAQPRMTLGELSTLLASPSWLAKGNLDLFTVIGGWIPIDLVPGETVFVISLDFASEPSAIYLRVRGEPTRDSIYNALRWGESDAAKLKITAMAVSATGDEDRRLITHSVEEGMKERLKASRSRGWRRFLNR